MTEALLGVMHWFPLVTRLNHYLGNVGTVGSGKEVRRSGAAIHILCKDAAEISVGLMFVGRIFHQFGFLSQSPAFESFFYLLLHLLHQQYLLC